MTELSIFEPDDRAIPYADAGEGPALVLIPGRGSEGGALGTVQEILVEEGFRVLRVAARRDAGDDEALNDRADDVLAVMDHVGLEDAWIGGHGFGGTVARAFAAAHTDRANGLVLLGVEESDIPLAPLIPVLLVQGTDDDVTPPANGEALRATAPERTSIELMQGAGHLFPATHPLETAEVIGEYIDWD